MSGSEMSLSGAHQDLVRSALQAAVDRLDEPTRLVVSYHLGWCDRAGTPAAGNGGKSVRAALALLSAQAAGAPAEVGLPGAVAVELVHNFSLLHDDLMDRDLTRRHRPTVWTVWGDATAVLSGDAIAALAQEVLLQAPSGARAAALLARWTREMIRGQMQDMAFESRPSVTLDECLRMVADKTGALLAAGAAIGAVLADAPDSLVTALAGYGAEIGIAFQLVDDLLGIWGDPAVTGKPVYSDLLAKKKSLPVTWTAASGTPAGRRLAQWLADGAQPTESELPEIAGLLESAGARDWVLTEAGRRLRLGEAALAAVDIPPGPREELLELGRSLASRQS